jgi:hypothetical protein
MDFVDRPYLIKDFDGSFSSCPTRPPRFMMNLSVSIFTTSEILCFVSHRGALMSIVRDRSNSGISDYGLVKG